MLYGCVMRMLAGWMAIMDMSALCMLTECVVCVCTMISRVTVVSCVLLCSVLSGDSVTGNALAVCSTSLSLSLQSAQPEACMICMQPT